MTRLRRLLFIVRVMMPLTLVCAAGGAAAAPVEEGDEIVDTEDVDEGEAEDVLETDPDLDPDLDFDDPLIDDDIIDFDEELDKELRIREIVHSATKAETTIQEAPAVIHVLTDEDMAAFGYRNLQEAMVHTPGFLEVNAQYDQMPMITVRGITQAVLYLRDGLSMFDPMLNVTSNMRRIPMETIKRLELTTSPGGVLWGANSFLGIMNVITKGPDDVDGVEMAIGGGHGPGDEMVIRPYVMYGQSFFKGRLKVFAHFSAEWFKGPRYNMPSLYMYSPPPRVNSPITSGSPDGVDSRVPLGLYSQLDGKIIHEKPGTSRRVTLAWQYHMTKIPGISSGVSRPLGFMGVPARSDSPNPALRENNINWGESYAFLQYEDRWLDSRLGLNTRGYYINFQRRVDPSVILPYSEGLFDGLAFKTNTTGHRAGATVDMDYQALRNLRFLWGGEVFYEWIKDANTELIAPLDANGNLDHSRLSTTCPFYNTHGDGIPVYDPLNPDNTTFVDGCRQPFIFDADRLVYAAFVSGQYRLHRTLILDGGFRFQHAPAGNATYEPQFLYSVAAVWNFYKDLFFKANYSTGFRPPVFNNTSANGAAVQFGGNPDVQTEKSRSAQAEFNAKLLRNRKLIRELNLKVNYSYTVLDNMIRVLQGSYVNSSLRAVHAVEFFTELHLLGGHRLNLAYTYARQHGDSYLDGGVIRSIPNHWLAVGGMFRLMQKKGWRLDMNTTFRLVGPFEDPNRVFVCAPGATTCTSNASDVAYDRVHPSAFFNLGFRVRGEVSGYPLELSANAYNVLDGRNYAADTFYDLGPRFEMLPTPAQRFYFFAAAKMQF